jgi:hypothetical protein
VPAGVVVNKDDTEFTEEEKQRIERALAETQEKNQVFLVVRIPSNPLPYKIPLLEFLI